MVLASRVWSACQVEMFLNAVLMPFRKLEYPWRMEKFCPALASEIHVLAQLSQFLVSITKLSEGEEDEGL
ncbi:MAG: hypothetical protein J6S25_00105 [Aeriscardovia sp.]|nr:hypothetical protein [Aeriscardovia sp.]